MSYEEYANLFLEESGIPCPSASDIIMRGCQWGAIFNTSGDIWQEANPDIPVSATDIAGSAELVFTKANGTLVTSATPVARHNQYLYFAHGSSGTAYIDEYNIDTKATITVVYEAGGSNYIGNDGVSLSWLVGRKVVLTDLRHANVGNNSQVWLIDFEQETASLMLEVNRYVTTPEGDEQWIRQLTVVKDSTENLHIICMGEIQIYDLILGALGYKTAIWDCNYTNGTTFDYSEVQATPSPYDVVLTGEQENYDIIQNRYIAIYGNISYNSGGFKLQYSIFASVYDIITSSLNYYTIQYGNWDYPDHVYFHSVDQTNGNTYICADGWQDSGTSYTRLIGFNPTTGVSSVVWSTPTVTYGWVITFESRGHAYFYDPEGGSLYRSYDQQSMGTFSLPLISWSGERLCNMIDDGINGECLWYLDGSTIKAVKLDGTNVVNKDLSGYITLYNHHQVIHLVNYMMVSTYKDSTTYTVNYYLVT